MFSQYLKKLRKNLGLSQIQFSAKLNLLDQEFRNIDSVTISRWEREVTTPSLSRCIRILRLFEEDISGFLKSIQFELSSKEFTSTMDKRFHDKLIKLTNNNYSPTRNHQFIIRPLIVGKNNDSIINQLKNHYNQLGIEFDKLFDIDLDSYQQSEKINAIKFIDNKTDELLGHSIGFFYTNNTFATQIQEHKCKIDYSKSCSINKNTSLTYYSCTRFSSSHDIFEQQIYSDLLILSKNKNIKKYSVRVILKTMYNYLQNIGFELESYQDLDENSDIKIGKNHYKQCIMSINVDKILSNKEMLTIFKRYS